MEKLQRRSDGVAETLSGQFAILPTRIDQFNWFDFRRTAVAPVTRVRWLRNEKIAVIDANTAVFMLNAGYAKQITDEQLVEWNDNIDELDLDAPDPAPVAVIPDSEPEFMRGNIDAAQLPSGTQTPGTAANVAAKAQTAPEAQDLANSGTPAPEGSTPATEGGEGGSEQAPEGDEPPEEQQQTDDPSEGGEQSSEGEKPAGKKKASKGLL